MDLGGHGSRLHADGRDHRRVGHDAGDRDGGAHPVSGVAVSWAATGGALTATTTTSGASGNAEVVFSSDATPRSYSVTATASGFPALVFTIVGQ